MTLFDNLLSMTYISFLYSLNLILCTYHLYTLERKYTKKHEWVQIEENNIGIVGISTYAQEALGDIVYAQLPDVGSSFRQKDECGALESVKAASEIYSPVSGDVTEKNLDVEETPSLINTSCYDKGWLFKIKLAKPSELDELLDEKQYDEFLKSDAH
jgi:glycine cleavage system H protein